MRKRILFAMAALLLTSGAFFISKSASASVAPSPCSGCKPPGPKCCTSSGGDDYYGNHPA